MGRARAAPQSLNLWFTVLNEILAETPTITARTIPSRGVQCVHCVLHKCIMVEVGGNEKHIKYVKKHVKFTKSEGKFAKLEGNKKIPKLGGNVGLLKPRTYIHVGEIQNL